jgi:hypothetical protein
MVPFLDKKKELVVNFNRATVRADAGISVIEIL